MAYHENYNNSSRNARLYARKRSQFHDEVASAHADWMSPKRAGESSVNWIDAAVQDAADGEQAAKPATKQKRYGHRPGTPGISHNNKPTFEKKFKAEICVNCGRTDLLPYEPTWKTVIDNTECDKQICYTETAIPGLCVGCGAITHPDKDYTRHCMRSAHTV